MRIGIDCRVLMSNSVGVKFYTYNLVSALTELDAGDSYRLYYHYFLKHGYEPYLPDMGNAEAARNPIPNSLYPGVKRAFAPWYFTGPVDVFHAPTATFDEYVPEGAPPLVVTIHDIAYRLFSGIQTVDFRAYYNYHIGRAVEYASRIITISDSTARDIEEHFPKSYGKITTVYNGVDHAVFEGDSGGSPYDFPYFLFVSTIEPRKNVIFLIRAFERIIKESGLPHRLVLAGGKGWLSEPIYEAASKSAMRDRIIFTGSVPYETLVNLYKHADLFLFPSLYEGFGLTPLEAQAAGIPVISSNRSSLPEVLGDGAILLNPADVGAWAEAAIKIIEESTVREELIGKGSDNAAGFTWERTARETRAVYQSVSDSTSRFFKNSR